MPDTLSKGAGVARLQKKLGVTRIFAAGDSYFDCTMLSLAHVGYAPESLEKYLAKVGVLGDIRYISEEVLFSQGLLEDLLRECRG